MPDFLIGFVYHEPEAYAQWKQGLVGDYESCTGLWVTAESLEEAIAWGEVVAEALHREMNDDPQADWRTNYHCFLEENPAAGTWAHCLDFFQRVRVGEMPPLSEMGTDAYTRWQKRS